jgi:trk system potassium uptake protein
MAILITLACGVVMWLSARNTKIELKTRDGFLLVVLVWVLLPAFSTLPLLFYLPELPFIDAYFETVSGLTTSGATVLTGLDSLPVSINVWRAQLVWLGGMGLIVLAVAVLPLLGVGGRDLFQAETPGPMKETKLTPRITETAKGLWLVYFSLTVACLLSFKIAGMSWLDALMHSFSTMGLGGFSSHDASFAYFDSVSIEAVAIIFMLVAGMNFATHFLVWKRKNLAPYKLDPEIKYFLLVTLASCLGIAFYLWWNNVYHDFFPALRAATFNTVSIATTTGFASVDYGKWPIFAPLWMMFLCTFATCAGSTGGGIKMIRAQLLAKQIFREFSKTLHPQAVITVKSAGTVVTNKIVQAVLVFVVIYVISVIALTLVLTISGLDFITAFSAIIACINNMGPGLNDIGPATTYASLSGFQKLVCVFAMLLGRLELFTLLIVFTPAYWRK